MKTPYPTSVLSRARLAAAIALFVVGATMAAFAAGQGGAASPRQHLFVGFTKTPGAAERALVERHGGKVRFSFPSVNALAIDLDGVKIGDLAREAGVSYVEPDPERVPLGLNDSQLAPDISNGLYGLVNTNVVNAHTAGFTGAGVKVCVADTGLDTTHPDIAANFKGGFNVFAGPGEDATDVDVFSLEVETTETHATHVSGTLLGVDNNVGILGVATQAQLYLARVLGTQIGPPGGRPGVPRVSGSTSQVMAGAEWLAEQGCKVINMSLGGPNPSRTEEMLYNQITTGGTLIVAAAGNEGRRRISFPAGYPAVMSVGAVDVDNEHASFSNTGTGLDISGPGVGVLSSVPDGQGYEAFVTAGATDYQAIAMEFSGTTSASGITATLFDCGLGDSANAFPPGVNGNIALIQRGSVTFAAKVANAMAAGAVGTIIYNNEEGNFSGTLGTEDNGGTPWIPAVSVSQADGQTLNADFVGQSVTLVSVPSKWDFFDGTSMATPHVAGVAGLVFGKNPSLTPGGVRTILNSSAMDLGAPGYDTTFGNGLVNATGALAITPASP